MRTLLQSVATVAVLTASSLVHAIPVGTYQLLDHPDAAHTSATNPYGLRMDDLGYYFSVERGGAEVFLTWDGGTSASISGILYNNQTDKLWAVKQSLSFLDNSNPALGFTTTDQTAASTLTLTDLGNLLDPTDDNDYTYVPKSNGVASFLFLADDHRCTLATSGKADYPGCGPIVARGWFQNDVLPDGSRPSIHGTNDWLVQAVPVPEPGVLPLLAIGLIGISLSRRKNC